MSHTRLEVCVDSASGLRAAISGGADRIELCSALDIGGLTPSAGLIALAAESPIPVRAMIRPRAGDFCYSKADVAQMEIDIDLVGRAGLQGVVLGASTNDHQLDIPLLEQLLKRAQPMVATLHRVVDTLPDSATTINTAIDLGFDTILTSGSQKTALEGKNRLVEMAALAQGRITIMPGSGVRAENVANIIETTNARWVHASCSKRYRMADYLAKLGFAAEETLETDLETCLKISGICRRQKIAS